MPTTSARTARPPAYSPPAYSPPAGGVPADPMPAGALPAALMPADLMPAGALSAGPVAAGPTSGDSALDRASGGSAAAVGRGVPWATVLPLAAVLAYADGFWMTSMRGAVGAVERTGGPFASWLRESTLVIPVFAAAVLAALILARRLFGPTVGRGWKVAATGLLVAGAGAAAGVAETAASSAYDYHLQFLQLHLMDRMHTTSCVVSCLAQQQQATLHLQFRAVGWAAALILATNIVLVGWMVALRGGRLDVSAARPARERGPRAAAGRLLGRLRARSDWRDEADPSGRNDPAGPQTAGRARDLRLLAAVGLLGAAAVHTAAVPSHLSGWPLAGEFFMLLSAAEVALAYKLLTRPGRGILVAAAAVSSAALALWLSSRTAGLPFGPAAGRPEAFGLSDTVVGALQAVVLLAALALLVATARLGRRPAASTHLRALAVLAVTAATLIGLAGTQLAWFGDYADTGHQHQHPANTALQQH